MPKIEEARAFLEEVGMPKAYMLPDIVGYGRFKTRGWLG